jgi:energy-coupling factor transporter ATP-binding protein EcfA2
MARRPSGTKPRSSEVPARVSQNSAVKLIYIRRIQVENLFGYLSYTIPKDDTKPRDLSRLIMLYGDNGSGKTTILRLLFALLYPHPAKGQKTYIARTPFKKFVVFFDDGSFISAERIRGVAGNYTIRIKRAHSRPRSYRLKLSSANVIDTTPTLTAMFRELSTFSPPLYFLPDDRHAFNSSAPSSEPENELMYEAVGQQIIATRRLRASINRGAKEDSHDLDVAPVLRELNSWFRQHAFQGTNTGEENATSIYLRIVNQIANFKTSSPSPAKEDTSLVKRLEALAKRLESFTRFGLIPSFPAERFVSNFNSANSSAKTTIETVLGPYVDGIEARLKALESIRDLITNYVETINSFLSAKFIGFTLEGGIVIRGFGGGLLDPSVLSSGEKQLFMLLSNTILARDSAGIFIIDEPELSLNVKWQRRLVDALLGCARGAKVQFILASHSLELITLHRANGFNLVLPETSVSHG